MGKIMIYEYQGKRPQINKNSWVAENAVIIGNVVLEEEVSIWWNAVLRGDNEPIVIGKGSNIQDGSVAHTDPGYGLHIGTNVTVGHMAMIHGCTIGDNSLIGIGAIILNGAKIGKGCLIGANSFIPEKKEIPDNSIVLGAPGKVIGEVQDKHKAMMERAQKSYVRRSYLYKSELVDISEEFGFTKLD
jgi:carbonic anhydrase/acetyltransferase-like protein (isoleucine patch superfamily)